MGFPVYTSQVSVQDPGDSQVLPNPISAPLQQLGATLLKSGIALNQEKLLSDKYTYQANIAQQVNEYYQQSLKVGDPNAAKKQFASQLKGYQSGLASYKLS